MSDTKEVKNSLLKTTELVCEHGGDLVTASQYYGIDIDKWLDLSTGLSPYSYPTKDIPASSFQQLPYLQPSFTEAVKQYYKSDYGIALIGSQMLIQSLPKCVDSYPVLLPDVGYSEHQKSWQLADFSTSFYPAMDTTLMQQFIDHSLNLNNQQHVVVINPNNPSGVQICPKRLIKWASQLADDCYLIVDEAFIDVVPSESVLISDWPENMVVLRSFGKFFGLAGIRIGFAFCRGKIRTRIEKELGLWMINGPAQYLVTKALQDESWQQTSVQKIQTSSVLSQSLFKPLVEYVHNHLSCQFKWSTHQSLFSSYTMPVDMALNIQDYFARSGILLRVIVLPTNVLKALFIRNHQFEKEVENQPMALLRIGILAPENREGECRISECIHHFIRDNSPQKEG